MKYTGINIPSLERIANALEKQNKLQEKIVETSERMLKLQENYFKAEEERRNNFRKKEEDELRNLLKDPRYWKHQDPEIVKRVEEGFKRLYG